MRGETFSPRELQEPFIPSVWRLSCLALSGTTSGVESRSELASVTQGEEGHTRKPIHLSSCVSFMTTIHADAQANTKTKSGQKGKFDQKGELHRKSATGNRAQNGPGRGGRRRQMGNNPQRTDCSQHLTLSC